jgi:hypothetical protein
MTNGFVTLYEPFNQMSFHSDHNKELHGHQLSANYWFQAATSEGVGKYY